MLTATGILKWHLFLKPIVLATLISICLYVCFSSVPVCVSICLAFVSGFACLLVCLYVCVSVMHTYIYIQGSFIHPSIHSFTRVLVHPFILLFKQFLIPSQVVYVCGVEGLDGWGYGCGIGWLTCISFSGCFLHTEDGRRILQMLNVATLWLSTRFPNFLIILGGTPL